MERVMIVTMNAEEVYPQRFADAVAEVVEEARWEARIGSIRELARLSGMTHTSLNARLAKTTPYTVRDLAALAPALRLEPIEILRRARIRLEGDDATVTNLPTSPKKTPRRQPEAVNVQKKAARKQQPPRAGE